jgi:4-hydroxythreonine-4-phosphate dehydrogenase
LRVGISAGDPSGIGPEIVAKALKDKRVRRVLTPVVFADASLDVPGRIPVTQLDLKDRKPGKPTRSGGRAQFTYLMRAIDAARTGQVDALCTAPVSKEQISLAGVEFFGHTEVLASAFSSEVLMLMAGPRLNVALATNHLPLAKVPGALEKKKLAGQLELLSRSLGRPRIAVCGVNPHASDGGLLGDEERDVIAPAVELARKRGVDAHGPFPADGLFAKLSGGGKLPYGAVLAMFHDQALCVAKALDFRHTVNVTLGLPLVRTSPDHGTAFDIAGTGRADASSLIEAVRMARSLVEGVNA